VRPSDHGSVDINCAGDRIYSGPKARSDAPYIHWDHPGCEDFGAKARLMPHRFRNSITNRGVSSSKGGMSVAVDFVSGAIELNDLVESVELLVALGGGQSGGNLSFSRLSLSALAF